MHIAPITIYNNHVGWQPGSQPGSHRSYFITQFLQSFVTEGFLEHHRPLWRFRDTDGIINYRWANPDFLYASRCYFVALWLGLGRRPPLSTQSSRTCTVVTLEQRSEIIHLEWPWGPTDTALLLGPASPVMRSWTIAQRTLVQLALPHRETFQNLFQNCHPLIKHPVHLAPVPIMYQVLHMVQARVLMTQTALQMRQLRPQTFVYLDVHMVTMLAML